MHLQDSTAMEVARAAALAGQVWLAGWAGAEALQRLARARFTALVAHARAHSPLYRELYEGLPQDAALQPAQLPPVTKSLLMERFDEALTDRAVSGALVREFTADPARIGRLLLGRYAVWTTSGTSGVPGWFLHDAEALAVYSALESFRFRGLGTPAEAVARQWAGERYALVAATGGHFAGVACVERLRATCGWLLPQVRCLSVLQPWPALVAELNAYRPHLLATYPTAAEVLADEQQAGRLHLRLQELWTGGECLHPGARARLERVFRCRLRNAYGASEFLSLAWECRLGRMHLNADWALLEPVDARHRPVPPGTVSHTVLLTNLANRVQPLIRYDLGDAVRLPGAPCPCGSAMPLIEVQGRADDVLALARADGGTVKLLPLAVTTVLEERAGVHDFQLEQSASRRLLLRLGPAVTAEQTEAARRVLLDHLDANALGGVELVLEHGPPRRSEPGGKLRRVVCASPPAQAPAPSAPPSDDSEVAN